MLTRRHFIVTSATMFSGPISAPVFVNVVGAWFRFMLRGAPGRPWGRHRQLHWGARRRPHGLRAGFLTALD